jgi:hypothetical protein
MTKRELVELLKNFDDHSEVRIKTQHKVGQVAVGKLTRIDQSHDLGTDEHIIFLVSEIV